MGDFPKFGHMWTMFSVMYISWTMVMVHIRNQLGILQNPNKTLTKKTTFESRLQYETTFTVLSFISVGQPDSPRMKKRSDNREC